LPVSFANPRRADWHRYKEVLTNILPMEPSESITNPQELDRTVNEFTEACYTAFKVACPTGKPRGRIKPPWWIQQLSILRTNCRCLFNIAKAGNEDTNWQNYKHERAFYKKAIRRAKRTAWQTFCSDIEKTTDAARLRMGQPSGSQVADSGRPLSRPTVNKSVGEVKHGIVDGNPSK